MFSVRVERQSIEIEASSLVIISIICMSYAQVNPHPDIIGLNIQRFVISLLSLLRPT